MAKVFSNFKLLIFLIVISAVFAAPLVPIVPTITDGLSRELPLFQVTGPDELAHITDAKLLEAASRVKRYNAYGLDPTKKYPDYPNMDGFTYPEQIIPLPDLWGQFCSGESFGVNILDAHLRKKDRESIVPSFLRQAGTKHDGSLVMSPAGFYTPTHLDDSFSRSYNGVWMYLTAGQKEWLFIHKKTMEDITKRHTLKQCRAMNIDELSRLCARTKNPCVYRQMLYSGTFMFFEGHNYFHCVQTWEPSLGLSGFSILRKKWL